MSYLCSGVEGTDLSILLALSLNLIYHDDEHGGEKEKKMGGGGGGYLVQCIFFLYHTLLYKTVQPGILRARGKKVTKKKPVSRDVGLQIDADTTNIQAIEDDSDITKKK